MITTMFRTSPDQPGHLDTGITTPLLAVVGFDGSAASRAALEAAMQLIRGRVGHLTIVYVAHVPAFAAMSAPAVLGIREGFNVIAAELHDEVRTMTNDREPRWSFERRDGTVAGQLVAAARRLQRDHRSNPIVVIVTGESTHRAHHVAGSVAASIAREAEFPLLAVPAVSAVPAVPAVQGATS